MTSEPVKTKRPWWVINNSLGWSIGMGCLFALSVALQIPGLVEDIQADQFNLWVLVRLVPAVILMVLSALTVGWLSRSSKQ